MNEKDNFSFYSVTISLTILVVTVIIFSSLTLNIHHAVIAEQQQQQPSFNEDTSLLRCSIPD